MNLKNDSYTIYIGTKNFTEKYYKDNKGWLKISAQGKEFRMTAEQVLNHLLPAVAGIKENIILKVEHQEQFGEITYKFTLQNLQLDGSLACYDVIKPFDQMRFYVTRQTWLRLVENIGTYYATSI